MNLTTTTAAVRARVLARVPQQPRFFVEIHRNDNTLEARHCLTDASGFGFHDGFTEADSEAGWRQVVAFAADGISEAEIEAEKAAAIQRNRTFWLDLMERQKGHSIVANGWHYASHELGVGMGFYGEAFRVDWLDASRPPLVCNLSTQGEVPGWLRPQCPDNATITNLDYLLGERPVISRNRVRRHLIDAGLRPSEAGEFLREHDKRRRYSRESHYWPSSLLHEVMKRRKRNAAQWFPKDIYIAD